MDIELMRAEASEDADQDVYAAEVVQLCDRVEALEAEQRRLRDWVNDLQAGCYINCVYCGHRYGPEDEVPATMAQVLKDHIAVCPEHPLSAATQRIGDLETALRDYPVNGSFSERSAWMGRVRTLLGGQP